MKRFFCVMAILWLLLNHSFAQVLDIGDTVPPAPFSFLSPGKLVILDFMATSCSGCIEALARMDTLQRVFGDRLQVIPVTYEDSARVAYFKAHNAIGKRISLPFVIGDTLLCRYFPHSSISHVIWIGTGRVVKAITISQYVKYDNIQSVLSGAPVHWPVKRDGSDIGADTTALFSSLSHFRPSLPVTASVRVDSAGGLVTITFVNLRVVDMLQQVFNCTSLPLSHVLLKVPDPSLFVYDASRDYMDQFDAKARYCYRAVLPLAGWQQKVLADLGYYLHIKAGYSYTNTKVLLTNASADRLYDLNKNYTGRPVLLDKNLPDTLLHPALRKTWMLTIQDYSTKTTVE